MDSTRPERENMVSDEKVKTLVQWTSHFALRPPKVPMDHDSSRRSYLSAASVA
jgi:hypothetical protein